MTETDSLPLIWEDETPSAERWWMSRAKDVTSAGRFDYFLVEDAITAAYVGVVLAPRARAYRVLAVVDGAGGAVALSRLKAAVAAARAGAKTKRGTIAGWRARRAGLMVLRDFPLALGSFLGGGALGLAISFMAMSSRVVGWPMILAGCAVGASAGPAFKYLVDRKPAEIPIRPWARFAVVTVAAALGAAAGVGVVLTMYWS